MIADIHHIVNITQTLLSHNATIMYSMSYVQALQHLLLRVCPTKKKFFALQPKSMNQIVKIV